MEAMCKSSSLPHFLMKARFSRKSTFQTSEKSPDFAAADGKARFVETLAGVVRSVSLVCLCAPDRHQTSHCSSSSVDGSSKVGKATALCSNTEEPVLALQRRLHEADCHCTLAISQITVTVQLCHCRHAQTSIMSYCSNLRQDPLSQR